MWDVKLFVLELERTSLLSPVSVKKIFKMISRFCHLCGLEVFLKCFVWIKISRRSECFWDVHRTWHMFWVTLENGPSLTTSRLLTSVVKVLLLGRPGSLPSCASVLCGHYRLPAWCFLRFSLGVLPEWKVLKNDHEIIIIFWKLSSFYKWKTFKNNCENGLFLKIVKFWFMMCPSLC